MPLLFVLIISFAAKWLVYGTSEVTSSLWLALISLMGLIVHLFITYNWVLQANEHYSADRSVAFVRNAIFHLTLVTITLLLWIIGHIDNWFFITTFQFIESTLYLLILGGVSSWGLIRGSSNALRRMEAINQITNRPT